MSDRWKKKCLLALEDSERSERELHNMQSLLRLAVSRLSLAAAGIDPELDDQLEAIRRSVKSKADPQKLTSMLDRVSDTMKRIDREQGSNELRNLPSPQILRKLVNSLDLPQSVAGKAQTLCRQLDRSDALDSLPTTLPAVIDLLARAMPQSSPAGAVPDDAPPAVQAALQPLLKLLSHPPLVRQLNSADSPAGIASLARSLATEVARRIAPQPETPQRPGAPQPVQARGDAGSEAEVTTAEPRFLQFLELLGLEPVELEQARPIRAQLAHGLADDEWLPALTRLAELLTGLRRRTEREDELTRFLCQLTDRLEQIDQSLVGSDQNYRTGTRQGEELAQGVQDELGDLQREVNEATDLPVLRQAIDWRTEQIFARLTRFRDGAQQRQVQWEHQLAQLRARLQEVESESTVLRQSLDEAQRHATRDALTGLMNRLAYDQRLAQEIERWRRGHAPLSLVVCDIDRFKRLNDTLGHQAGDKVLQSVAEVMRRSVRSTDHVARYGGEEFVVLLPNAEAVVAATVAEKIRHGVESANFQFEGKVVAVTLSCGYAEFLPDDTAQSCFARADRYLYAAKDGGRNRVLGNLTATETAVAAAR